MLAVKHGLSALFLNQKTMVVPYLPALVGVRIYYPFLSYLFIDLHEFDFQGRL